MKIAIASDHRGYELKQYLIEKLEKDYDIIDIGTNSNKSVDYPDYAFKLCERILKDKIMGIAICGSGIGISIACNKVKGIRCSKVSTIEEAKMTRNDNDSNVIALSCKVNKRKALKIVKEYINTPFSNEERHVKRINKINEYEQNK